MIPVAVRMVPGRNIFHYLEASGSPIEPTHRSHKEHYGTGITEAALLSISHDDSMSAGENGKVNEKCSYFSLFSFSPRKKKKCFCHHHIKR